MNQKVTSLIDCTGDLPADWTLAKVSVFIDESLEFCESVQPRVCRYDVIYLFLILKLAPESFPPCGGM